jgi:hypothetical protein
MLKNLSSSLSFFVIQNCNYFLVTTKIIKEN